MSNLEVTDGYVLHRRPWRESSLLIDCLSKTHGRIGLVARGGRSERSPWRGLVEPFMPLSIGYIQKGEMGTVRDIEALGDRLMLTGEALWCGLYANELLLHLIDRQEAVPALYSDYQDLLVGLSSEDQRMPALRRFEWRLLNTLGVAPSLSREAEQGDAIDVDQRYRLEPEAGFFVAGADKGLVVDGATIVWLADPMRGSMDSETLKQARLITRTLIDHQLGGRPLRTREMMRAMR
ncbi:MAG TPA: DNA repair protein RecO [Wenzhouxiangella sp.]